MDRSSPLVSRSTVVGRGWLGLVSALALLLSACGSADTASGDGGAQAQAPAPAPAPAGAVAGATAVVVPLAARDIAFDRQRLQLPAGAAIRFELANRDTDVPHGLAIMGGPGLATEVVAGAIIVGPGQTDLEVPTGLIAGGYQLICPVHPATMIVDLQVGG